MTHPFCRCPANMVVMTLGLQSSGLGFESRVRHGCIYGKKSQAFSCNGFPSRMESNAPLPFYAGTIKKTFLGSSKFQGKEWGQLLDFTGTDESYVYPITREASRSEPTGSLKVSSRSRLSLNDSNNFDGQYTLHFLRTLSLSGNELENISSHISKAHSLEKLYLHSNQLSSIPKFSEFNNLQVLDLACNKINQLELASIVPKGLTYLDLCQRSVAVVDVNCAGRQAPLTDNALKETEICSPWILGFTESQDGNTRIYIEFQKDPSNGKQEALIALMELDDTAEVGGLRNILPELLKAEKEGNESYPQFLRNSLVTCVR
ncbi:UNVERIFIED_CONTAM: Phlpp [Trichonephila clavipes]